MAAYEGPIKNALYKLKYQFVSDSASKIVEILINYWAHFGSLVLDQITKSPDDWLVTSVPLHIFRQNIRGFNQSELLAQILAKQLGLNYTSLLKRHKATSHQVGLIREKRIINVKGAFSLIDVDKLKITNCVLLVDDVWTTGSTLKECAKVLKKAGVKQVWGLTIAR